MCTKQTSVSHSSTESEIISLDAGLRMDGLPALDFWNVVIEVVRSSSTTKTPTNTAAGNCSRNQKSKPKRENQMLINCRMWTTSSQAQIFSQGESHLYIFEDNEAVIKNDRSNDETRVKNPQSCS